MIITSSDIQLAASHQYSEKHEQRETMAVWQNDRPPTVTNGRVGQGEIEARIKSLHASAAKVTLSKEARKAHSAEDAAPAKQVCVKGTAKLNIMRLLVERLTGKKIKIVNAADFQPCHEVCEKGQNNEAPAASEGPERQGWGLVYEYDESYHEAETTTFSAQGTIHTADGQKINFTVALNMSREFMSHENITVKAGDALIDPLVINFDGLAAELETTRFDFDLDVDGAPEQIAFVRPGSGFLALDNNGDGVVNNGSELFGPTTGDGFAELARYDEDGNNWIDEGDSVYGRLRIWTRDEAGNIQLFGLGYMGIGAIYLANIETPFSINNAENQQQGEVRSSGIYVREDATVGTVQQLDMVV